MKLFDRFRKSTPWIDEADELAGRITMAVYQVTRMAAKVMSIDWDSLDSAKNQCATISVVSLYVHWTDRRMFSFGDQTRSAVGEIVVAKLVAEFSELNEDAAYEQIDQDGVSFWSATSSAQGSATDAVLAMMPALQKSFLTCVGNDSSDSPDPARMKQLLLLFQGYWSGQNIDQQIDVACRSYIRQT